MPDRIEARKVIEDSGGGGGLKLYVVTSVADELAQVQQHLEDHLAYLRELEDRGVLFAAGPLFTQDGEYFEGDGMLIYRAGSLAEAHAIADADPMHVSEARTYRVRPWFVHDGNIGVRIILSQSRHELL
ncbi:YciI family protein [Mycobacterium sp. ML4]